MKKILKYVMSFALALCVCGILSACGQKELESITIDASTFKTEYIVNDPVDSYEDAKVYANYSDGSKELIDISLLEITDISTETFGTKTLKIKYKEFEKEISVTVYNSVDDTYSITGFEKPGFVVLYEANIDEKDNKEAEFADREQPYTVGDDNAFVFLPEITALNDENVPVILNAYRSVSKVYEKNGTVYTLLEGDELTNAVAIDETKSSFDFTEEAIGKTFKIEVNSYYYPQVSPISFEFTVADGWNAYSAKDLSKIDNKENSEWATYKQNNNVSNAKINGIFLHNNINITSSDVPTSMFYNAGDSDLPSASNVEDVELIGSFRDSKNVYNRFILQDETFTFNGNYFSIDTSSFPLIGYYSGKNDYDKVTHAQLFRIDGPDILDAEGNRTFTNAKFVFNNVNMVGGTPRSEKVKFAGGLIMIKCNSCDFDCYNNISTAFTITYFPQEWARNTMEKCKAYDNFSSILYSWGETRNTITGCDFKRCGGPVSIMSTHEASTHPERRGEYVVDSTSTLESWVTGEEGWFSLMGAGGLVSSIKQFNSVFSALGKALVRTRTVGNDVIEELNAIALNMNGDVFSTSGAAIEGKFVIADKGGINMNSTTEEPENAVYNVYRSNLYATGAPLLQSNGIICYTDGTGLLNLPNTAVSNQDLATFAQGEYLTLSYPLASGANYSGLLIGFFSAVA